VCLGDAKIPGTIQPQIPLKIWTGIASAASSILGITRSLEEETYTIPDSFNEHSGPRFNNRASSSDPHKSTKATVHAHSKVIFSLSKSKKSISEYRRKCSSSGRKSISYSTKSSNISTFC